MVIGASDQTVINQPLPMSAHLLARPVKLRETLTCMGQFGGSDGKESACNAGDPGSISGSGRSPEKRMAIHSSILAWEISRAEEPGGLKSMGLQRVGHN